MVKFNTLIEKEFKENNRCEITLISVHGIETKIRKNDKIEETEDLIKITRENGELEIITYADPIFKVIAK